MKHDSNIEKSPLDSSEFMAAMGEQLPESPRRNRGRGLITVIVAVGLVTGLLAAFTLKKRSPSEVAEPKTGPVVQLVRAVTVKTGLLEKTLAVTGTLKANLSVDLGAKGTGRVSRVLVREGTHVRRGQLLVTLEDAEWRAQVQVAQAGLRTAQVRLRQQLVGLPANIADVDAAIKDAEANLGAAQAKYRQAQLQEPARVTGFRSEVEVARQAVKTAQARVQQARETVSQTGQQVEAAIRRTASAVESAKSALRDAQRGSRDQEVAQAQSEVAVLEAQLVNAETELKRAQALLEVGVIAQSSVDAARTLRDVFTAQRDKAAQNLSLVREGKTSEMILQSLEAVRQAEAQYSDAEASRAGVRVAQGEVTAALAALAQAQETLRKAQANLADIPALRQQTRIEAEAVRQAQAALVKAIANRSDIPVAREEVQAARAGVESAQANLLQAQTVLADARIVAPIDGVVNTKAAAPGQAVGPGTTLLNIVATDSVYFEAKVDENEVREIRDGIAVRVWSASVSERSMNGLVADVRLPIRNLVSSGFELSFQIRLGR